MIPTDEFIFFRGVGQPPTSKGWLGLSCSLSLGGLRFRLRVRKSPDVLPFLRGISPRRMVFSNDPQGFQHVSTKKHGDLLCIYDS